METQAPTPASPNRAAIAAWRILIGLALMGLGLLVYALRAAEAGRILPLLGQAPAALHAAAFVLLFAAFDSKPRDFLFAAVVVACVVTAFEIWQKTGGVLYFGTFDPWDVFAGLAGAAAGALAARGTERLGRRRG